MKGVTFIRVKLRPVAECQHVDCGWASRGYSPATTRADAQRHVAAKGHIVNVTVSDVTEYAPEVKP